MFVHLIILIHISMYVDSYAVSTYHMSSIPSPVVTSVSCPSATSIADCFIDTANSCANNPYIITQLFCATKGQFDSITLYYNSGVLFWLNRSQFLHIDCTHIHHCGINLCRKMLCLGQLIVSNVLGNNDLKLKTFLPLREKVSIVIKDNTTQWHWIGACNSSTMFMEFHWVNLTM